MMEIARFHTKSESSVELRLNGFLKKEDEERVEEKEDNEG